MICHLHECGSYEFFFSLSKKTTGLTMFYYRARHLRPSFECFLCGVQIQASRNQTNS